MMMFLRFLVLSLIWAGSPSAVAAEYCLALRGNGEVEPAHWGAVSNVVERLGLPRAQSGGSSATITMFFLDAIATNKDVRIGSARDQALNASLLVKSLEGFTHFLMVTQQFRDFTKLYGEAMQLKDTRSLEEIEALLKSAGQKNSIEGSALVRENLELIRRNFATGLQLGLISQESVDRIELALQADPPEIAKARFHTSEVLDSIRRMGDVDADHDPNLFFRPGIVDFNQFATQVERIGDFYASANWSKFFANCREASSGRLWSELVQAKSECASELEDLTKAYFQGAPSKFSARKVGVSIPSFPTTTVLTGTAQEQVAAAFTRYSQEQSANFGAKFHVSDPEQIRFGYWGDEKALQRIQANLPVDDEKSRRFLALGSAPWHEVLALSPAEPGLAALQFFSHGQTTFVSAGGWSDLAPVLVLKASGCTNVVYATRRGKESVFSQGVARRLFGPAYEEQGLGALLFDVERPTSSLKRSLESADAVLCSDWDRFKIQDGPSPMVVDAYRSPYFLSATSGLKGERLSPLLDPRERASDGSLKYLGCF